MLLGECNGHPTGWLRDTIDPLMSHASATSSPPPVANMLLVLALILTADDLGRAGGSGDRSMSSHSAANVGKADAPR